MMDNRQHIGLAAPAVPAGDHRPIPKLLHYTWRTRDLPARFRPFVQGWRRHHPGWTHRLWTDEALRAFVAQHDPAFLAVFDGYRDPIMRVDAARYLVMTHLGGVFVDLDLECFRPIEPLLQGHSLVIGTEPESHGQIGKAAARNLDRLLCPTFLASVPGHPFWADVRQGLVEARADRDPLDATGPFLLSRVHRRYRHPSPVRLVEPSLLYPVDRPACWRGALFDIERWDRVAQSAYTHHHWDGTWFRRPTGDWVGGPMEAVAQVTRGTGRADPPIVLRFETGSPTRGQAPALVSCLMVTTGRAPLARIAIQCFQRQTWPDRELVIVDDDPDDTLARHVESLGDPSIRHIHAPSEGRTLGALRNQAVAAARGGFICQWDDDDLYDPLRIELQMQAMALAQADACFLPRWLQWLPRQQVVAVSARRVWEGSMLCRKDILPPYPERRRGEDTPVTQAILARGRVVHLDLPRLYLYIGHERNTHEPAHHLHMMSVATARFEGVRATAVMHELARRLPIYAFGKALAELSATPLPVPASTGRSRDEVRRAAEHAMRAGRFADALHEWEEILRFGESPAAMLGRAEALTGLTRYKSAADAYALFARRFPQRPQGPCGMARVAMKQRQFDIAAAACAEALRRAPDDPASLCETGHLHLSEQRYDEAEEYFRRSAANAPDHPAPLLGLAETAVQGQDWQLALERWRAIWERFRDPSAPEKVASALTFLDRADEARSFLAGISDPRWDGPTRLSAWCSLARLMHDWERIVQLLDDERDTAIRHPVLRRAYIEALNLGGRSAEAVALVRRFGIGRTANDQMVAVRALMVAGLVDTAHERLRHLAGTPDLLQTSPRLLPDILSALRETPGPDEARRVLDRLETSPGTARNLQVAAIFERDLDRGLAALSGQAPLPAASSSAAARVRQLLARPADRADRTIGLQFGRALTAIDAIHARYPDALLDIQTNPSAALSLGDRVAQAIGDGTPMAVLRLGDGEGNFLPYPADQERHRRADQASIQRIWWNHDPVPPADLQRIEAELASAIRSADIVGIPDLYRMMLALGGHTIPSQTSRGTLAVIEQFAGLAPAPEGGRLDRPGHLLTSCHLHNAFAFWRIWDVLFGRLGHCTLVTGRSDLANALKDRFGLTATRTHLVPPERKFADRHGTASRHFPDRFEELRHELARTRPGEVVLVAAGILGKAYCAWVRQAGGIAIDIGSAADHWCGRQTRTVNEAAAFRPPPHLGAWYAGRGDLDEAYPALRPSAYFRGR